MATYYIRINIFGNKRLLHWETLATQYKHEAENEAKEIFFNFAKNEFNFQTLTDEAINMVRSGLISVDDALVNKDYIDKNIISKVNDPVSKWGENVFALGNTQFKVEKSIFTFNLEYTEILH